jgi:hypothetical protein
MSQFNNPNGSLQIDYDNIVTRSWQNFTIDAQTNTNDRVCIIISPAQFRSLLSANADGVSLAHHIIQWALRQNCASPIVILIADEIQKYNVAVFQHKNEQASVRIATSLGQKISSFFSEACNELPLHDSEKIQVICWKDMISSSNYDALVEKVRQDINRDQSQCISLIDMVRHGFHLLYNGLSDR